MTIYSVLDSQNHSSLTLSKGSIPFLCIPFLSVYTAQYHNMDDKNYNYDDQLQSQDG